MPGGRAAEEATGGAPPVQEKQKIRIFVASEETRSHIKAGLEKFEDVELVVRPLATGDYICSDRVGVECKASIDDFIASVEDKRIWDQMSLLAGTYARPILLLNGVVKFDWARGKTIIYRERSKAGERAPGEEEYRGRYPVDIHRHPHVIQGIFAAIEVGYGVPIHRTTSIYEACNYIYRVAHREQRIDERPVAVQTAKKRKMTVPELQRLVTESLGEGVGPATAEALLCALGTPEKVITASAEELRAVEGVGPKRAERIREVAATPYVPEEERKRKGRREREGALEETLKRAEAAGGG